MNKRIQLYGTIMFDYIFITILLNISIVLVIPFIPVVIGLTKYFTTPNEEQSLTIIFKTIKENLKIILQITFFLIFIVSVSIINLYVIDTENSFLVGIVEGLSYIMLLIATILFIHSPIIVCHMNVSFKQLIYNSIMLSFGGLINFFTSIGIVVLFAYMISQSYLVLVFGITLVIYLISRISYNNLIILKEKNK